MEDQTIDFSKLEYGAYEIGEGVFEENIKYGKAEFMRLNVRRIRLPDGRGNLVYLLSDTFENSLKMLTKKHFVIPPTYRRFYYPWIAMGNFMRRRYRMNLVKLKAERIKEIKAVPNLRPVVTRFIPKTADNVFFSAADLYQQFVPIFSRYAIKRIYSEFYPEFIRVLKEFTPEIMKPNDSPEWNNRLLIIDAERFAFDQSAGIKENQTNPLFILYLAYIRTKDLTKLFTVDQDMMICSKDKFIKFNPKMMTYEKWMMFKRALFRIMNVDLDQYTEDLPEEEKKEIEEISKERITQNIVTQTIAPYTQMSSGATKDALHQAIDQKIHQKVATSLMVADEIRKAKGEEKAASKPVEAPIPSQTFMNHPIHKPLHPNQERLFRAISSDYTPLLSEEESDEDEDIIQQSEEIIQSDVSDMIANDEDVKEEVLDDTQERIMPIKNKNASSISSERDRKLREEQKKIVVKNSSIEEILMRDVSNVPIQTENKSKQLHTSNQNVKNITFSNFDKTYIEELYTKDLVSCFDMLKDKNSPFYITGIDVKDSSTNMDLKETWSVHVVDRFNKRSTIKVDIPKFYQNKFMIIGGNKYIILKQNFYNPLVKDTPDTVILTTNFNKVTITRRATRSLASIERIFTLLKKTDDTQLFVVGDSSKENQRYISTLEYDEFARRIFRFKSKKCTIIFSRKELQDKWKDKVPSDIKGNEFFIGMEGTNPILINEDTGRDRTNRTIAEIIRDNLSDEYRAVYDSIKPGSTRMYSEAKMAGQFLPVVVILMQWIGLTKTLDHMGIQWEFNPDIKRIPNDSKFNYIRFKDGILAYEPTTFAELILNGLYKLKPEKILFKDCDNEDSYLEYMHSVWGNYNGLNEIKTFYEFLLDPITKDVCRDLLLPTDIEDLLIYAIKLLADNACVPKASDKSYRVRSVEMIPAILYSCIAAQYKAYQKSGGREPMTLNQRAVISKLMQEKSVDEYSTLNPSIEVAKSSMISTKGYKGSNSEYSYDEEKRSYDPSAVGKIAMTTSNKVQSYCSSKTL